MRKIYLFFIFFFFMGWHGAIYAKELPDPPVRWFIQTGAFSSAENAINESKNLESVIEKTFDSSKYDDPDIAFGNHVFTFEENGVYRVYIGAYSTKQGAEDALNMLPAFSTKPHIVSMKKNYYDNIAYNYRFTLSEIPKAEYEKAWQQLFLSQENVTSFAPNLFMKTSMDQSHRFVYDGSHYFIETQEQGEWKQYPISDLLKRHNLHLKFNSLYWSLQNELYFYDFSKIDRKTYSNVYKIQVAQGQPALSEADGGDIGELEKQAILRQENISTIFDFDKARELLKAQIEFGLDDNHGINSIKCGGEEYSLAMPIYFDVYFPDEHIFLGIGEGFSNYLLSTKTCGYASYPYFIRHPPSRNLRLNGYDQGEFASPSFFVEIFDKDKNSYTKMFELGSLFIGHPDLSIDSIIWNGDTELLFTLDALDGGKIYYKIIINKI